MEVASMFLTILALVNVAWAVPQRDERCLLNKTQGDCEESHHRFYFDKVEGKCKAFFYSGCNGNENNFYRLTECESACGTAPDCTLPQESGLCRAYFPKYYHDSSDGKCKKFIYGGCGGNSNRFDTLSECYQRCRSPPNCTLPPETGNCYALMPMYYYDASENECKRFIYGGCGGNENRYSSIEECEHFCEEW